MKYIKNILQMIILMARFGPLTLFRVMSGYSSNIRFGFIYAAYECGLLEALRRPRSFDELSGILSVKRPEFLEGILQLGTSLKEISKNENRYALSSALSRKIINDEGAALLGMIQTSLSYVHGVYLNFSAKMNGTEAPGGFTGMIGEQIAKASRMTEGLVFQFSRPVLIGKQSPRILEVGCGSGIHLRNAAKLNKTCSGIGMDLDEQVVQQAKNNVDNWGLSDHFTIIKGDIRRPPGHLAGPFDIITFHNLAYYFNSEERKEIFQFLKSILSQDGTLMMVCTMNKAGQDPVASHFSLALISYGVGYPVPDVKYLSDELTIAGFKNTTISKLLPGSNVYGIKAFK